MNKLHAVILSLSLATSIPLLAAEEEPVMTSGDYEISERTKKMADDFASDVKMGRVEKRTHKALDTLIRIAVYKLRYDGHKKEAIKLLKEWQQQYSEMYMNELYRTDRHIGDHAPVSQWLKDKMDMLTLILGVEVVYNLRLSDISTFNETPKVILFCADQVDEDEYYLHWVHDGDVYKRGLAPTVVFWVSEAACLGASMTTGFIPCAIICGGAEYLTRLYIAPKTNNFMWSKSCKQ